MNPIYLAELTHTCVTVDAKNTPLAIGYLGAYLKYASSHPVEIELFKYPDDLNEAVQRQPPRIIAFSNYMWNEELSLAFAKRIKSVFPNTIIIFGGPNYPTNEFEQAQWLKNRRQVDFYIDGEGEVAFCKLVDCLLDCDCNPDEARREIEGEAGIHFYRNGHAVTSGPTQRIIGIEEKIPSPYLSGIMDKFFDKSLSPLVQTSRGCPYSCAFCHDGSPYANKVGRFSLQRATAELDYIARRVQVPSLTMADLNWGMFPEENFTP